jgi:hypothetical protein
MSKKAAPAPAVNKSQLIREIKEKQPSLKPMAICDILADEHGSKVAPAYVSTILSQAKAKQLSGRVPGKRGRPSLAISRAGTVSFDNLLKAKQLIHQMGGIMEARAAVDAIARIMNG